MSSTSSNIIDKQEKDETFSTKTPPLRITKRNLRSFSQDVDDLWTNHRPHQPNGGIPTLDSTPDALTFLRDFVSLSRPCIIRGALPLTLSLDDLVDLCDARPSSSDKVPGEEQGEDSMVMTVDVTPDGHGDCVRTVLIDKMKDMKMFVRPEERQMGFSQFRDLLRSSSTSATEDTHYGDTDSLELDHYPLSFTSLHSGDDEDNDDGNASERVDTDGRTGRNATYYYSRQNDCLRTELKQLFDLNIFPPTFSFAEQAFGTGPPDAINLWIGNETSVSSMHKDHYENLFYVLSGEKVFTVCPPADAPFLGEREFEGGVFRQKDEKEGDDHGGGGDGDTYGGWVVDRDVVVEEDYGKARPNRVRWIEPDIERILPPLKDKTINCDEDDNGTTSCRRRTNTSVTALSVYLKKYPSLAYAHPMRIHVNEGDMLYLPALWYHRVTQTCETVAINYWYDMRFDSPHWCYFNLLQHLGEDEDAGTDD